MSVIYLAKQALNGLFATSAFIARSITSFTVASPSDLIIFGKPSNKQLAFDGYCNNIEAFVCATSLGRKINCDLNHYPFDPLHKVTVPINLPRTVFALRDKPSEENEKKMMAAGKDMGIEKLELGKGHVYTIEKPTIEFLSKIRKVAPDICTGVTDYSQLGATFQFHWIVQSVDLFLATNTYSYRPGDLNQDASKSTLQSHPHVQVEFNGVTSWANGCGDSVPVKKRKLEVGWENRVVTDTAAERGYDSTLGGANAVFVAKPSPLPSKTSWGLPSECPNTNGIHFPYFEGLHHSDVKFTRSMINKHFFRNLGSSAKGPREAYQEFRSNIGPAVSTPSGRIMNHILYGIDLALGTQTQLYLLFDKDRYYGFNLLGGYFSVWAGQWVEPAEAKDLQAEMQKYRSHEVSMKALTKMLRDAKIVFTDSDGVPKGVLKTSQHVAALLGRIDQEKTESDVLEKVENAIGSLVFEGSFRVMNGENLDDAVDELLGNTPISPGLQVYVPHLRSAWKMLASPYYVPIGSFGARSFSLRDRGGKAVETAITSDVFKMKLTTKDKEDRIRASLPFFEKPCNECIVDWGTLVNTGKGKFNFAERAIGSRGFLLRGEDMKNMVGKLEAAKEDKKIGNGALRKVDKGKKKEGDDIIMGEDVSLGDLF